MPLMGTASSCTDVTVTGQCCRVNSMDSETRSHHCLQSPGKAQSGWLALHPNPSPSLKTFLHDSEKTSGSYPRTSSFNSDPHHLGHIVLLKMSNSVTDSLLVTLTH